MAGQQVAASGINIYPKNNRFSKLDLKLFRSPTSEYRGTPFWSWNNKLRRPQLLRQIEQLKQMGFGGFHMHSRTGMGTPYLGDEFMSMVKACADKARKERMLAWLYDEDRWPSGFAGGLVTQDDKLRAKHLLWTCRPYGGTAETQVNTSSAAGNRRENGQLLARYEVVLKDGSLDSYRKLKDGERTKRGATTWYAYLETAGDSSWFNNQAYADTLSQAAMRRFVEVTHDRYAQAVGQYFGSVVPAIFTDEPQFTMKTYFGRADEQRDLVIPFTDDLLQTYQQQYKQKLEDALPELFWELPDGKASATRWRYHDHVTQRFADAFGGVIGDWCEQHGIALTGHMMAEESLNSQTLFVGEAMRTLAHFQIPGIDLLCDSREYTTAKQAQSVAHQYGRCGALSELYGVTNWDFDFAGHKAQGDWQAALGITVRVPHLAWVSMAGEAKRDYPAAISYQSPWYKQYGLVEDHFARVNVALTRGRPGVRVGVIHPIESYWLTFGPSEQTKVQREEQERAFQDVTRWILFGLVDFDYISEALLPEQCPEAQESRKLRVGKMAYDTVVVPNLRTIRSTTLDRLEAFAAAGGTVVFAGQVPALVDARPLDRAAKLAARCTRVDLRGPKLVAALEPCREIEARHGDGSPADSLLHQIRVDGDRRHIFICNADKHRGRDTRIRIRGDWGVTLLDTLTGEARPLPAQKDDKWTALDWNFPAHGSVLLTLSKGGNGQAVATAPQTKWTEAGRLGDPVKVTLSEPNVLLLSQAQWKLNDGAWQPLEEILRIDVAVRKKLALVQRHGGDAQPWTDGAPAPVAGTLSLRFAIRSDVDVRGAMLAVEEPAKMRITLDGKPVAAQASGWWVDEAIKTVPLPRLSAGEHELILQIPFTRKTNLEWCYVLGDFGVQVTGRYAKITAPVRQLAFGDWCTQGLPFYAGNVTYHCTIRGTGRPTAIEAPKFKSPLLSVQLDSKPAGRIAFAPFQLELGELSKGWHTLDLTAFGNRVNAFGAVHNADETLRWFGPTAWRQNGHDWSYEYQLKRMGILVAPTVKVGV